MSPLVSQASFAGPSEDPRQAPGEVKWADKARREAFYAWLDPLVRPWGLEPHTLRLASADASFRRYLRVSASPRSLIIMDAPPGHEDLAAFVRVAALIERAGLMGPRVLSHDPTQGFALLTDLGDELLLEVLRQATPERAHALMLQGLFTLVDWQCKVPAEGMGAWGTTQWQSELSLFETWCVQREYQHLWDAKQAAQWQRVCALLVDSAAAQPMVAVHRDWMPRNLMLCGAELGILDFQDAASGPITYDVVSWLRDAFITWEESQELDWAVRYWQRAREAGLPVERDFSEFWRQLEWMGLQRHLRILGVFCRLKHRDGKPQYAQDLPRFFGYATRVAMRYRDLHPLLPLLEPLSGASVQSGYTF